jgi:prepilin-type N-terminal cleavage/methylation domain-containing protein
MDVRLTRLESNRGVTLMEVIVVCLLIGVAASVALPRALRSTPRQEVVRVARQLTRDLELVRTRAVSAKRVVRVRFDPSEDFYTAFMDTSATRSGSILEEIGEVHESKLLSRGSFAGLPGVNLPKRVQFGAGDAIAGPLGEAVDDPVLLDSDRVEFNSRGMVTPLGTTGVIYVRHRDDPLVVAAVTVSGAGAFQTWHYRNGVWER